VHKVRVTLVLGCICRMEKLLISTFIFFAISCGCKSWGDYELGGNYRLMSGDGDDETILIYCTTDLQTSSCCHSGIELIPQMVSHVNFNENWIIAKTEQGKNNGFWIIKKTPDPTKRISSDSKVNELKANVFGPLDSLTFNAELQANNIGLDLKKFSWR